MLIIMNTLNTAQATSIFFLCFLLKSIYLNIAHFLFYAKFPGKKSMEKYNTVKTGFNTFGYFNIDFCLERSSFLE